VAYSRREEASDTEKSQWSVQSNANKWYVGTPKIVRQPLEAKVRRIDLVLRTTAPSYQAAEKLKALSF